MAETQSMVVFETPDRRLAEFVRHALTRAGVGCEAKGRSKSFLPNQLRDAKWELHVSPDDASRARGLVDKAVAQLGRVRSLERPRKPAKADTDSTDVSSGSDGGSWLDLDFGGDGGGDGGGGGGD